MSGKLFIDAKECVGYYFIHRKLEVRNKKKRQRKFCLCFEFYFILIPIFRQRYLLHHLRVTDSCTTSPLIPCPSHPPLSLFDLSSSFSRCINQNPNSEILIQLQLPKGFQRQWLLEASPSILQHPFLIFSKLLYVRIFE